MHKRREGFTLIELLIVIVIIGILAAIAIPKFGATREKAYVKAMESDLRNLAAQQEIYYSDSGSNYEYWAGTMVWDGTPNPATDLAGMNLSSGVTIVAEAEAPGGGVQPTWSAVATHEATTVRCEIYTAETAPSSITIADYTGVIKCAEPAATGT